MPSDKKLERRLDTKKGGRQAVFFSGVWTLISDAWEGEMILASHSVGVERDRRGAAGPVTPGKAMESGESI